MQTDYNAIGTLDLEVRHNGARTSSAPTVKTSRMILMGAFLLALVDAAAGLTTENIVSFSMDQMESKGPFRMAPVKMHMASDMMEMDSMILDCQGEQRKAVVYTKMSTEKVTMDSGATQTTWRGMMKGGLGFATFMQTSSGSITGTFSTKDAAYSVFTDSYGNSQMKMTRWADFPNFSPRQDAPEAARTNTTGLRFAGELTAAAQIAPMTMAGAIVSKEVHHNETLTKALVGPSGRRFLRSAHRGFQSSVVRVLLIVTNAGMCEYTGLAPGCDTASSSAPIQERVPLLQDEMNWAMQGVGVDAAIEIVNVIYLDPGYDGLSDGDTLEDITKSPNIAQWRQENQADLVAMIVRAGSDNCGIAYVHHYASATPSSCFEYHAFTHELGHNFGALHDRGHSNDQHPYGHGYHDPNNQFRTVMAYDCPGGCPVIPFFSANGYEWDGVPFGTPTEDNARLLSENAPQIAGFV